MCTRCFGSVSQSEAALGFVVSDDDDMNIFVVTGKESEDGGSVKQASKQARASLSTNIHTSHGDFRSRESRRSECR